VYCINFLPQQKQVSKTKETLKMTRILVRVLSCMTLCLLLTLSIASRTSVDATQTQLHRRLRLGRTSTSTSTATATRMTMEATELVDEPTKIVLHVKQAAGPQFPVRPTQAQAQAALLNRGGVSKSGKVVAVPPPKPPKGALHLEPYAGGAVVTAKGTIVGDPCNGGTAPSDSCGGSAATSTSNKSQPSTTGAPVAPKAQTTTIPAAQFGGQSAPAPAPASASASAPVQKNPVRPAPLPVEVPAANIGKPVTPQTQYGDPQVGVYSVDTSPNVRIIGEDACGCPEGQDPCKNPCTDVTPEGLQADVERKLDGIKTKIVEAANQVKEQAEWVGKVKDIIKHYQSKISAVSKDNSSLKTFIRKLFKEKKHYEDLMMQQAMDPGAFLKAYQEEESKHEKLNTDAPGPVGVSKKDKDSTGSDKDTKTSSDSESQSDKKNKKQKKD
jgi:hypothetical protein